MKKINLELTLEEAYVLEYSLERTCVWSSTRKPGGYFSRYHSEGEQEEYEVIYNAAHELHKFINHIIETVEEESEQNA